MRAGHARDAVLHRLPAPDRAGAAWSSAAATIGLEKVEGLLACDAEVTLVAPEAHPELVQLALEGSITWERREYRPRISRAA